MKTKDYAVQVLRDIVPKGASVYVILTKVSQSGLFRRFEVLAIEQGKIRNISYRVAEALEWRCNEWGVGVKGAGMDMGYHLVHCLGSALGYHYSEEKPCSCGCHDIIARPEGCKDCGENHSHYLGNQSELGNCYGLNHINL